MKSVICREPGIIELGQRGEPGQLAEGWVLLDIHYAGLCGTDYHIYEGKHPFLEYPRVIGHELSGTISDANGVDGFKAGDRVVVNPYLACGACIACRNGKPNCCEVVQVLGVHRDGGLCERLAVPAANLVPAGDLALRDAAMVEFLAIGAHAVRRAGLGKGNALVVGAGPIGLGVAVFAWIAGLDVTMADVSAERIEQSREILGGEAGILMGGDDAARQVRRRQPGGFDVVFDATGNSRSIMDGFQHVAHGGTYVLVSVVKDDITFSDPEFHKREMSLIGSRNATSEDFRHVIASIEAGLVPLEKLATHETTLEAVPDDLPRWAHDKRGLVKALVRI
ncbi:zinc-binding alcohol dehydrogenase family protein [Aquamicrobium sp. LC103]|uniref:zinc-binding alcohol dehydrogenase family protein n=1 Tax=Aquamicrobium sp. LC103 TaxID=1120658 RepID=UPI00063E9690|nr:zinc-binding alcohol dehydrogenase family protein [Aquamicrobium sp. LC103]TKT76270.1 zinc-binding alcohol dehydrogenase family protein [Aquamicrobium sp. LC103]